ncbi:MAG: hypothetical protein WCZ89_08355 [Phycisphaerae bacterium]
MANLQTEPNFLESCMFTKIFQTFRLSIHPSKLVIAFGAIAIIAVAGTLMDIAKTVVVRPDTNGKVTELQIYMHNPDNVKTFIQNNKGLEKGRGVFSVLWSFAAERFEGTVDSLLRLNFPGAVENIAQYTTAVCWAFRHHMVYCAIFGIIKLIVICIAGGAICRISALQFALGEKPGISDAILYSLKKFPSFAAAPLAPIGISLCLGVFIFLIGLFGNIPRAGELIVAIGLPLALVAGTLIAIVLIGTIGGFNLMFPALAYDGLDCFDAISRSFNYVYSKPWRMGFYTALVSVYGAICYIFVRFFAFLMLYSTHWALRLGVFVKSSGGMNKIDTIWPQPEFSNLITAQTDAAIWSESAGAFIIYLFVLVVLGLVMAFLLSFYFSANTIIYALMRSRVDNTPLDEIHITEEKIESLQPDSEKSASQDKTEPLDSGQ